MAAARSQSPSLRGSGRFSISARARSCAARLNPLHCGAVVASRGACARQLGERPVSIPFIAGQWSLLPATLPNWGVRRRVSIPFIAGQWSLLLITTAPTTCAVMSQSPSLRGSGRFSLSKPLVCRKFDLSQSPSLRGSGRFPRSPPYGGERGRKVSIPFIAGQWSLQPTRRRC